MQTTLLGIAIAFILALVSALVGPHFVDWNNHRAYFEAKASQSVGVPVRVSGPISASLLPTPSVSLTGIAIGPAGEPPRVKARALSIDFGLGALLRGEVRASEMRLSAPEFSIGLDSVGQLDAPGLALATETLSIDRLDIADGRVTLSDAATRTELTLAGLSFSGEVRSLAGPARGEGTFETGGRLYGYRLTLGRYGSEGMRVRLAVDDPQRPVNVEAEGTLAFDRFGPRFEGSAALARPAGVELPDGRTVSSEPWRVTAKVKGNTLSALFEQVEFQYGPDERAMKLTGAADLKLGPQPRLKATLSARQLDLDRLASTPEATRRPPLTTLQAIADIVAGSVKPPVPVDIALSVDAITLGGGQVHSFGGDLSWRDGGWRIAKAEFRAPGFTQVQLSGGLGSAGPGFAGAVSIEANDPRTLVGWIAAKPAATVLVKPLSVRGDVVLGPERIAVERLKAEFDRGAVEGRLDYAWASTARPARLEAQLRAGDLDVDALIAFAGGALSGIGLERPRDIALALEIGRAKLAGFEARNAAAKVSIDPAGIAVERLSVADFGSARIEAMGRIDTAPVPGGAITVNLDASDIAGMLALADRFAPAAGAAMRRLAAGEKTARLTAGLSLKRDGAERTVGGLDLVGRLGAVRVNLQATAGGKAEQFAVTDMKALSSAQLKIDGQIESGNAGALLSIVGLGRVENDSAAPGKLTLAVSGLPGRDLAVEGRLTAGPVDAKGKGALRLAAGSPASLAFERLAGTFRGSKFTAKGSLTFGDTVRLDGDVDAEAIDAAALVRAATGLQRGKTGWSAEPIQAGGAGLSGGVAFKARKVAIADGLAVEDVSGAARLSAGFVSLDDVTGRLARGRVAARLMATAGPEGMTARGHISLQGADAAAFGDAGGPPPVAGRLFLTLDAEGAGISSAAFIGSLSGNGTVRIENGRLAGLSPHVFDAAMRAADLGMATDATRVAEFADTALRTASLPLERAEAAVTIAGGQMRFADIAAKAHGVDLRIAGRIGLADATLESDLMLTGRATEPLSARPWLAVALRGPIDRPRRSVDASALAGWLALRAVEQQTKRLEAAEAARREAEERERRELELARENAETLRREAEAAAAAAAAAQAQTQVTATVAPPVLAGEAGESARAPDLPAPVTVLPLPRPRATPPPAPVRRAQPPQSPGFPLNLLGAQ